MSLGRKLLIVGPSWVGDMVMAQALYRVLKGREPQVRIDVVAPPWSVPVLGRMPEVARAIELPVAHGELGLRKRIALGRRLRAERYDRALVLPRSLKAAIVPWFAAVPVRTGFRGEWRYGVINDMRALDTQRLDQTVKRFVALAPEQPDAPLPDMHWPALRVDRGNLAALAARLGLSLDTDVVALMPGAEYGAAKRWPGEYFAGLAARLASAGIDVWIIGSAKERELGAGVQRAAAHPAVRNLCGETSLADAIDLLARAAVAVTNDSGLMHVAAAVDTHVVALYGSSSPAFTPPLTDAKTVIYLALECSPCWERSCPLSHLRCLREIPVNAVYAATIAAVGRARSGSG